MKVLLFLALSVVTYSSFALGKLLDTQEGEVLKQLRRKFAKEEWSTCFDSGESLGKDRCSKEDTDFKNVYVKGKCPADTTCHITELHIKRQNLSGGLPLEFTKLPYLQILDLSRNYLSGTIPSEWATMRLSNLSLMGNKLSGPFPTTLTVMTTLLYLSIEGNCFSGTIPREIGNLKNLNNLYYCFKPLLTLRAL